MTITRFAPSPTGYLHIGGARTALFAYAFARNRGGQFLLRIEDTDRERSGEAQTAAILDGLAWLGLEHDGEIIYQHAQAARHVAVAEELLASGRAYKCSCTAEEVEAMREAARAAGKPPRYNGKCRNGGADESKPCVIRFAAPQDGETIIEDAIQGTASLNADQFDDLILVRSDGSPTYMLSVVVDDHDMGVSDIIRGNDHATNAARQKQIYEALNWDVPNFAHLPLIHGQDGAKLSKRHGALGVQEYQAMGYLPEAMLNYLARLGWSHGDDEIFSLEEFVKLFSLEKCGNSPARFDIDKLDSINAHYIKQSDDAELAEKLKNFAALPDPAPLAPAMGALKDRAKTLQSMADDAKFIFETPTSYEKEISAASLAHLNSLAAALQNIETWQRDNIETATREFLKAQDIKMGAVGPAIRLALTGKTQSLGIFDLLTALPKDEVLARLKK